MGRGGVRIPLWLMIPALLPVLVFSLAPLVQGIALGFTDYELGNRRDRLRGLANYAYLLSDTQFWRSFRVGGVWTAPSPSARSGSGSCWPCCSTPACRARRSRGCWCWRRGRSRR
jgi:hypothetical protein